MRRLWKCANNLYYFLFEIQKVALWAACMTVWVFKGLFNIPKCTWKQVNILKWNFSGSAATCFCIFSGKWGRGEQTPVVQKWIVQSASILLKMSNFTAVRHKCLNTRLSLFFPGLLWITTCSVFSSVDLPEVKEWCVLKSPLYSLADESVNLWAKAQQAPSCSQQLLHY